MADEVTSVEVVGGVVVPPKGGILERVREVLCEKEALPLYQHVERRLLGHGAAVLTMAAGRQHDELLLSASKDRTCRMWDLEYATCVRTITGHSDAVRSAVFSLDDRLIFTGGDTCVRVWDRNSPREVACFRGHHGHVTAIDVQMRQLGSMSYGLSMISSSYDCSTRVWDLRCKMAVRTCIGHQKPVTCNSIMSDGKTVISGSLDAQCRFYDSSSVAANVPFSLSNPMGQARQIRVLKIAKNAISRVRLSPDNKWLASSSLDGNVGITRIGPDTTTQLKGHAADEGSCDCAWHSSNASIATAGGRDIIIWDIGYLLDQEESKSRPITQQARRPGSSGGGDADAQADRAADQELSAAPGQPETQPSSQPHRPSSHGSGRQQILPAKAVVRLSGGGISSDDCGNDGDRLHSMLWLCGNGQTQGEAGGGLHNRMSYGGLILGGTEDGSISCWTVPQEVTDLLPHRTSGLDWPQSGGGEVLRVGTPAQGTRDGIAQGNGA